MSDNIAFKLTGDAGPITDSVKSLKAQLREATEDVVRLSARFGDTSTQAIAAARSAAGLREQISDSRDLINAFHPEQKFNAFGAAIQGVAGGFSALTGAMGLFGADSEDLQKTLVKVQSAMALSEGLNSVMGAKDAFMKLGALVKGPIIAAFNFLKLAMMTNPIMLLVTVLAGVVLSFKKTRDAIMNFIPGLKQVGEFIGDVIDTVKEWIGATETAEEAQEKLKEATDELSSALEEQYKAIDAVTKKQVLYARIAGKTQDEINAINDAGDKKKIEGIEKGQALLELFYGKNAGIQQGLAAEKEKLQIAELEKTAGRLDVERSKRAKHERGVKEDKVKTYKELLAEMFAVQQAQHAKDFQDSQTRIQTELALDTERVAAKVAKEMEFLNDDAKRFAERKKLKDQQIADELEIEEQAGAAKKEIAERTEAAKLDIISAGLGAVSDLIGRETVLGKGIAVAQSIINTYQGATKALATYAPPFGAIAAGTVIAAGLANVKKIISTKIPGQSGGGSVSIPSAASVPAPIEPQAQVSNTRIDQGQVNAMGNATVRAFVTETDVTGNQERIRRLNRAARI